MGERERAILGVLEGAAIPDEIEPDEWDLEMITQAKNENNGFTVSLDVILTNEGLTYADIQD